MRLRRPPYPEVVGTAVYFFTHAGHRQTAIETALSVIREADKREHDALAEDPFWQELTAHMGEWVIESLLQGAWMREYHEWEKATKAYFDGAHARNGGTKVDWKGKLPCVSGASHVDRVRAQLALFGASVPADALAAIDYTRDQANLAKHEAEHFIGEADYQALMQAVMAFWNTLAEQEEFTPPAR
ncbi:MAG: hypothetical protein WB524_09240 [Acidobacteriaceae bacterium]